MRIAIGALVGSTGGPRTYAYHLIEKLAQLDNDHEYIVLTDRADIFSHMERLEVVELPLRSRSLVPFWEYVSVPMALRRIHADLYHNTRAVLPWLCPCPAVMTIHDLAPFVFPDTFTKRQQLYLRGTTKGGVRRASFILTVSEYSRKDIIDRMGVAPDIVRSVYNGVTEQFYKIEDSARLAGFRARYSIDAPMLLCLGTIQPRKNLDIVIRSFAQLKRAHRIPHHLYIVGREGWLTHDLENLVFQEGLQDSVVFTGAVPDEDVPVFCNVADIFLSPSSYEGFGLNILEAMACGTPVVTTGVSSIPEVTGDAALTVHPRDVPGTADAVARLIQDTDLKEGCIEKGLMRAKLFTWDNAAQQIAAVYREQMEQHREPN